MIDLIKQKISGYQSDEEKINRVREFLQIVLLKIMFDRQYFDLLSFVGGTALRILYGMRRYSEDLDFSLTKKDSYSFAAILKALKYELDRFGLDVEATSKEATAVHASMIKFSGLLKELGLSGLKSQKLSIKLEIDTNPPPGWNTELSPVSETYIFAVRHYDMPSLFASKLHACFFRRYTKGRDFYDLIWYLGRKIRPNYALLNNAIYQTQGKNFALSHENIKEFVISKIAEVDFNAARKDVERFVEDKSELKLMERNILTQLVEASQSF